MPTTTVDSETGEIIETTAVALPQSRPPAVVIAEAQERAKSVADIIRQRGLAKKIQGKEYVQVEGWSTLAAQYGLVPSIAWSRPLDGGGFEAQAELRRMDNGTVVATAQAECGTFEDGVWPTRAAYAQRSMAETRAASKVCRIALSWVMVLAGYSATPAEEVPSEGFSGAASNKSADRIITVKQDGQCADCKMPIAQGEQARWNPAERGRLRHPEGRCAFAELEKAPSTGSGAFGTEDGQP